MKLKMKKTFKFNADSVLDFAVASRPRKKTAMTFTETAR